MVNLRLKELRKLKLHLSQADFAKMFNIPQTTYSTYESGRVIPPLEFLLKICDKYGISLDYLCCRDLENHFPYGASTDKTKNLLNEIMLMN